MRSAIFARFDTSSAILIVEVEESYNSCENQLYRSVINADAVFITAFAKPLQENTDSALKFKRIIYFPKDYLTLIHNISVRLINTPVFQQWGIRGEYDADKSVVDVDEDYNDDDHNGENSFVIRRSISCTTSYMRWKKVLTNPAGKDMDVCASFTGNFSLVRAATIVSVNNGK
ncbi:Hypothetical predicted protein [Octopus vulgaris]|uniref:Uncharacterized protein n=1 Tax=Octopus vulgaris TaxID=6645 RepID=A0AA36BM71_OCTVU|nr:Hypothetical predicted protein [Octopus vulgaris]